MNRDEALQEALRLMDPDGLLRDNDSDRVRIERMVSGWLETYGTEIAFRMAQRSHRYLKTWKMDRDMSLKGKVAPTG